MWNGTTLIAATAWLICAAAVTSNSRVAYAHGQFPTGLGVQQETDGAQRLVVRTNYGLIYVDGELGGAPSDTRVQLVCDELAGDAPNVPALVAPEGVVLTAYFKGLYRSDNRGCDFATGTIDGAEHFVRDFALAPAGDIYIATSSGSLDNDVFRSSDGGLAWKAEGALTTAGYLTGLAVTGGDADLAAVGFSADGGGYRMHWRTPGGWTEEPLADLSVNAVDQPILLDCADDEALCLVAAAADPQGRVFAVRPGASEQLVWSEASANIQGAALLPSGAWLVATRSQLVRSTNGGEAWDPLSGPPLITGLSRIAGAAYVLGNPYLPGSYLAAQSTDDGESWRVVLQSFEYIDQLATCPVGSGVEAVCEPLWADAVAILGIGSVDQPAEDIAGEDAAGAGGSADASGGAPDDTAGGASDGGPAATGSSGGCASSPRGPASGAPGMPWWLLVAAGGSWLTARARRRRRE